MNGKGVSKTCSSATDKHVAHRIVEPADIARVFGGGRMGFRPEEKGIKTKPLESIPTHAVMGFRPEEKGIKTSVARLASHASRSTMGFRPEEKGIKTTYTLPILTRLHRWDSDLKKKGLRPRDVIHVSPIPRWDSDLKKKGLRLVP